MPHRSAVVVEREKIHIPWIVRYLVTGQYILSKGDNADFLHDATEDYRQRPVVKLTRARWRRVMRRNAAITMPLLLWAASITPWVSRWAVVAYLAVLVTFASGWSAWWALGAIRGLSVRRRLIDPAAQTLHAELGARYVKRRARASIQVPRGWRAGESDEPVRVVMPVARSLTAAQRSKLVRAVGGRLGIPDARGHWFEAGPAITVDISGTPLPPAAVTLDDLAEAVAAAPATRPIVGMGPEGPLSIDYEQDSPHVACSGAPGTGKSTLFRLLAAQRMHHGHGAIFLDFKRWSHRWAHRLPQDMAQYWYRPADMHDALVALGEELDRRINGQEEDLGQYRTIDVYVEEINSLIKLLTRYWTGRRREIIAAAREARDQDMDYDPADLDPPALSPAVAAMQYGVFMGRELQIHFHAIAQKLEANVFGSNSGGAVRDCFQIRFMAGWDRKVWKMLAGSLDYVAWPGGKRGLWGVALNGQFHLFRVPNLSTDEAAHLATSGQRWPGPVLGGPALDKSTAKVVDSDVSTELSSGQPLSTILDKLPGQDGPDALSLEGLRTAVKRAGHPGRVGRVGQTYLYDLDTLASWRGHMLGIE